MKVQAEAGEAQGTSSGKQAEKDKSCFNGLWKNSMDATNGENQISEVELISSGDMDERSKLKEIWIPNKNITLVFGEISRTVAGMVAQP